MITTMNLTNPTLRLPAQSALLLTATILVCFALPTVPKAFGVSPPPDGGYANDNTAAGQDALFSLTIGFYNTAIGFEALFSNTSGSANTAIGFEALFSNTTGNFNTAIGDQALSSNTTGAANTANGLEALFNNTIGNNNTASGEDALFNNTTGYANTAIGASTLNSNTIGTSNTASGYLALGLNTTGSNNTAEGFSALSHNTTGSFNIALGNSAGINLTKGNNNIDIGSAGLAGESNTIRIGTKGTQKSTFIAGISGAIVPNGVGVIVGTGGKLWTVISSARFKEQIKPMEKASEAILKLEPVSFRYKHDLDPAGIPQFGLVAEQVEKVAPELVARDDEGKPFTVRYEAVSAMLLNEFLKEHRTVQELKSMIKQQQAAALEQQARIEKQEEQIESLGKSLQTASDQLELNKPARRIAAGN